MDVRNDTKRSPMSDEEIVALYWQRDENAIRATDAKYRDYLMAIARNIVRDLRDCEECLNDTYLGTWNRIPPARPNVFQCFLSKITQNIAVDKFRQAEDPVVLDGILGLATTASSVKALPFDKTLTLRATYMAGEHLMTASIPIESPQSSQGLAMTGGDVTGISHRRD